LGRSPACQLSVSQDAGLIRVTRLNGSQFYINAEMIRFVEATPDTVISLTDGVKLVVRETPQLIVDEVIAYRQQVHSARLTNPEVV
jgi:flagellar protein FlbD